ncbi:MAG: hypothetical protein ACU0CT_13970 [Paracoccaceae bacterium]
MKNSASWTEIESSLQLGLVLVADLCELILGEERGRLAAKEIIGFDAGGGVFRDDLAANNRVFLKRVKIDGTQIEHSARRCFRLVAEGTALHKIDVHEIKGDATEWLEYFLKSVPRVAMGGQDMTSDIHDSDSPLPSLLSAAEATLELASFVQNLPRAKDEDELVQAGFSIKSIAALAQLDIRSVRNEAGPRGKKPLKTTGTGSAVSCDPLKALEWLAGRRGFNPGYVAPDWMNSQFHLVRSRAVAHAIPGVVGWVNKMQTVEIAGKSGMSAEEVRNWIYNSSGDASFAKRIADTVGLDGFAYEQMVERLA